MLSRVAESIYWMSRQVERAENLARFLEVTHNLTLDQAHDLIDPWQPLIEATADRAIFDTHYDWVNAENVTQFVAFERKYPNSMISSLRFARENARGVRESLSSEAFEQLNNFYKFVDAAAQQPVLVSPNQFFDEVRRIAIQWTGVLDSTMPRDLGWQFANVGRLLERADKTSRILDVKYFSILPNVEDVGTAVDDLQWSALLLAISGIEAYRRKHHLIEIDKVIGFFLFNEDFPRSLQYCVSGALDSLERMESTSQNPSQLRAKSLANDLHQRLLRTDVKDVLAMGMHQFVDSIQTELNQIGHALDHDYFHAMAS